MKNTNRNPLTQAELRALNKLEQEFLDIRKRYEAAWEKYAKRIRGHYGQEPGKVRLRPRWYKRRSVSWKGVVIRREGVEFAKRVLDNTKPKTYFTMHFERIVNPKGGK